MRKWALYIFLLSGAFLIVMRLPGLTTTGEDRFQLFYSNNVNGETDPCG